MVAFIGHVLQFFLLSDEPSNACAQEAHVAACFTERRAEQCVCTGSTCRSMLY